MTRPQGARLIRPDGEVIPLELAYRGQSEGMHVWEAAAPCTLGDRLEVDVLPARTTILLRGNEDAP